MTETDDKFEPGALGTVVLELDEDAVYQLRRPARGNGGFQSAIRRVLTLMSRENKLVLGERDIADIRRLAMKYRKGGFQTRLRGVLAALDRHDARAASILTGSVALPAEEALSQAAGQLRIPVPPELRDVSLVGCEVPAIDGAGPLVPISVRLANVLRNNELRLFGHLQGLTYEEFGGYRNCGRKTVEELRRLVNYASAPYPQPVAPLVESAQLPSIVPKATEGISGRLERLKQTVDGNRGAARLSRMNLSVRALRLLDDNQIETVTDLQRFSCDELLAQANTGRRTLLEVVSAAEAAALGTEIAIKQQSCVEVLDSLLSTLPERSRELVIARFAEHRKVIKLATEYRLSRERVRQIEEKFIRKASLELMAAGVSFEAAAEDRVIEFHELSQPHVVAHRPEAFYVAVVRTLAIGGDSYVDAERFYRIQAKSFLQELAENDQYASGRLTVDGLWQLVYSSAPPLRELPESELWSELQKATGFSEVRGCVVGKRPGTRRIILAILRRASGALSISVLLRQIEMTFASYGETSYFNAPILREKLSKIPGAHLLDQNTVSMRFGEPQVAEFWREKAVSEIVAQNRPFSLVFFLRAHPDCPFDLYALASLLRSDQRVVLAGKRLYASANYEAMRSLSVARLMRDALIASGRPMTRAELRDFVRSNRDMVCGQVENYFPKIEGLQLYTDDVVGLAKLDKAVMLSMLETEACILSLVKRAERGRPVDLESVWLLDDEAPDLLPSDLDRLVKASRKWKSVFAEKRGGTVFFSLREI